VDLGSRPKEKVGALTWCSGEGEERRGEGRKRSTYTSLKPRSEGSPCCMSLITTQCLDAFEWKRAAQTC